MKNKKMEMEKRRLRSLFRVKQRLNYTVFGQDTTINSSSSEEVRREGQRGQKTTTPGINIHSDGSSENETNSVGGEQQHHQQLSSSGTSGRSVSPKRAADQLTGNLLNLDIGQQDTDSHENVEQTAKPPTVTTIHDDFGILLDLADESTTGKSSPTPAATTATTASANTTSDLESLLGGFDTVTPVTTSAAATPTTNANVMFDPFGASVPPAASGENFVTPTIVTPLVHPTSSVPLLRPQTSHQGAQR